MSDPLYDAVKSAYESLADSDIVNPSWLATMAMDLIGFQRDRHELAYLGCHLHFRQLARGFCRKSFDPVDAKEDDLFPETLQGRYPRPPRADDAEPEYILRDLMTDADVAFNVTRLRKEALAKKAHADALEAWHRNRRHVA